MRPPYLQFYFNAIFSNSIEHYLVNVVNSDISIDIELQLHRFKTDWLTI